MKLSYVIVTYNRREALLNTLRHLAVTTPLPLDQWETWVVDNAYAQRPFADTSDLRMAFQDALFGATPEQQRELMTHYPALGSTAVAEHVFTTGTAHGKRV